MERFDISPDEAARAAPAIARSVIAALQTRFPAAVGVPPALASNQRTSNPDAYRLWLRGQERLNRRGQSVRESADLFREAIRHDSLYGQAYAGLSMALVLFPHFQNVPTTEIRDEVIAAATRALALDSTLAMPHTALALLYQFEHQWDRAEREHQAAVRLDGRNVEVSIQYGRHFMMRGRSAEARRWLQAARAADPASAVVMSLLGAAYYQDGMMDSALAEARRAISTDSTNLTAATLGARVMLASGRADSARSLMALLRSASASASTGYVLAKSGDTTGARRLLHDLETELPESWMANTSRAMTYLGLEDTASALAALERATDAGEIWTSTIVVNDPVFSSIRDSERFRRLVARVGLADALVAPARRPPRT